MNNFQTSYGIALLKGCIAVLLYFCVFSMSAQTEANLKYEIIPNVEVSGGSMRLVWDYDDSWEATNIRANGSLGSRGIGLSTYYNFQNGKGLGLRVNYSIIETYITGVSDGGVGRDSGWELSDDIKSKDFTLQYKVPLFESKPHIAMSFVMGLGGSFVTMTDLNPVLVNYSIPAKLKCNWSGLNYCLRFRFDYFIGAKKNFFLCSEVGFSQRRLSLQKFILNEQSVDFDSGSRFRTQAFLFNLGCGFKF